MWGNGRSRYLCCRNLSSEGINCTVVDMHTIKPLDIELIAKLSDSCGAFVSAEDHSVIGGLGGALSEWLSTNTSTPLEMVGLEIILDRVVPLRN